MVSAVNCWTLVMVNSSPSTIPVQMNRSTTVRSFSTRSATTSGWVSASRTSAASAASARSRCALVATCRYWVTPPPARPEAGVRGCRSSGGGERVTDFRSFCGFGAEPLRFGGHLPVLGHAAPCAAGGGCPGMPQFWPGVVGRLHVPWLRVGAPHTTDPGFVVPLVFPLRPLFGGAGCGCDFGVLGSLRAAAIPVATPVISPVMTPATTEKTMDTRTKRTAVRIDPTVTVVLRFGRRLLRTTGLRNCTGFWTL